MSGLTRVWTCCRDDVRRGGWEYIDGGRASGQDRESCMRTTSSSIIESLISVCIDHRVEVKGVVVVVVYKASRLS